MDTRSEDRVEIADLMTRWLHRDLGEWDQLLDLFHPDATVGITWFEGTARDFVDASRRMGASNLITRHVIANPVITFRGDRALVQTNATILAENPALQLGCTTYGRFWDRVEKRAGAWKIVRRQASYDMGHFTFLTRMPDVDEGALRRYPREYAALAYLLEQSGFPLVGEFPTRGSKAEIAMKSTGADWLDGTQEN
jgi:SnoaL-like protein